METVKDNKEWNIRIPTGENRITTLICERCPIILGHMVLSADLIVLEMKDFDIILGMDWLSEHYAFIDCRSKKVIFKLPGKETYHFEGIKSPTLETVSASVTCVLTEMRNEGYLVSIQEIRQEDDKTLHDIAVVREFPEDLPGLSPPREVEFAIELIPGS